MRKKASDLVNTAAVMRALQGSGGVGADIQGICERSHSFGSVHSHEANSESVTDTTAASELNMAASNGIEINEAEEVRCKVVLQKKNILYASAKHSAIHSTTPIWPQHADSAILMAVKNRGVIIAHEKLHVQSNFFSSL